jgi:hypothetical protein
MYRIYGNNRTYIRKSLMSTINIILQVLWNKFASMLLELKSDYICQYLLVSRWLQPTIVSGLTTYRETRPPHGEQCRQTHARF